MDPDACLAEIRRLVGRLNSEMDEAVAAGLTADLCEHIEDMDDWLSTGGFLPKQWDGKL